MRVRLAGIDAAGRALDCRGWGLDPERVVRAVRDPADDRVRCPRPGSVHDHVGLVAADATLERRKMLAAVARSRGVRPAVLDRLDEARARLADHEASATTRRAEREQVAEASGEHGRLRERVARLRGEIQARREAGLDTAETRNRLREAARELSEVATERTAATQRLDRERERARESYDARERRLELEDRVANLEREARARLAETSEPLVADALARLTDEPFETAPSALATLAAARVAVVAASVVVAAGPFGAEEAASWLDAPVIRL